MKMDRFDIAYSQFGKIIIGYDHDMISNDIQGCYMRTDRRRNYTFDKKRLWIAQNGICHWCGKQCVLDGPGGNKKQFTVDHIIPLSVKGTNHWMNLVGSCHDCNNSRGKLWDKNYQMIKLYKPENPINFLFFKSQLMYKGFKQDTYRSDIFVRVTPRKWWEFWKYDYEVVCVGCSVWLYKNSSGDKCWGKNGISFIKWWDTL